MRSKANKATYTLIEAKNNFELQQSQTKITTIQCVGTRKFLNRTKGELLRVQFPFSSRIGCILFNTKLTKPIVG